MHLFLNLKKNMPGPGWSFFTQYHTLMIVKIETIQIIHLFTIEIGIRYKGILIRNDCYRCLMEYLAEKTEIKYYFFNMIKVGQLTS